ncbi:hypothetical protein [Sorangium sp. So ce307]|uniref:hypothetical protein n=1 Tax=Sorangium sp. So ce307 TaxID=3133298 RepID=UPI002691AC42
MLISTLSTPSNIRIATFEPGASRNVLLTNRKRPNVCPVPSPPTRATKCLPVLRKTLPTTSESSRASPSSWPSGPISSISWYFAPSIQL